MPSAEARVLLLLGGLHAMRGRFAEARDLVARSRSVMERLGMSLPLASGTQVSGIVDLLAGDPVAAEREFRTGYERLEEMGHQGYMVSSAAFVARALYEQGRFAQAEEWTVTTERLAGEDDPSGRADWATTRAKVLARRGAFEDADALAREAVAVYAATDDAKDLADALADLGEVLELAGRSEEASAARRQAIERYEAKGIVPAVDRLRPLTG